MYILGAAALLLASESARSVMENVFADMTVFFANNVRLTITAIVVIAALVAFRWLKNASNILNNKNTLMKRDEVQAEYSFYENQFKDPKNVQQRQSNYKEMVNSFYDLVTDFYEWGWGKSFHFSPRFKGETFREGLLRAEYFLANRLRLDTSSFVADVGCGVGGPARNISRFAGCRIMGINNNDYQLKVATKDAAASGLSNQLTFRKADFMHMPVSDNTFDGAYAIEATCHAPDKVGVFKEVFRTLKPGGRFAVYEWCITKKYNPKDPMHVKYKEGIEVGNGLPELATTDEVVQAMKAAGFRVLEACDMHDNAHDPKEIAWYKPLQGSEWSLQGFLSTKAGGLFTHFLVTILEFLRIAPKGTVKVSTLLRRTQVDLIEAGKRSIFTPGFFCLVEKPKA